MSLKKLKKKKIILISIISAVLAVSIALAIILPIVLKKKEEPNNTPTKYFGTISVSADNAHALLSGSLTDGTTTVALSDLTITSETDVEQWLSEFELLKSNNKELTLNINIKNTSDKSLCVKVEDKSEGIKNVKKSIKLNQKEYEDGTYTIIENKNDSIDFAFDIKITNITNLITYFDYQIKLITDVQTLSEVNAQGIDLNFDTQTKTAEAKAYGTPTGELVLPKCIFYNNDIFELTKIADYAFQNCTELTSVTIGNSITSIGVSAFRDCTSLTKVIVEDVNRFAQINFYDSTANPLYYAKNLYLISDTENPITNLVLDTTTKVSSYAFYNCTRLTNIIIPNSVTSIESSTFSGCTSLTSVTIPNSVTSIGFSAFSGCTNLTSITIPNSVTSIESSTFYNCTGLTSVTILNSVTSIGSNAFRNCTSLTSVTIPDSVTSIDNWAFLGCTNLTSITIPNSVTSIESSTFSGCTGLTSVTIGNSVTSIGNSAFSGCSNLAKVIVENVNKFAEIEFGNSSANPLYYAKNLYLASDTENPITHLVLDTATKVGSLAFYNFTSLKSATIGNNVQTIESYAFSNSTNLTFTTIGNSVISIETYAFNNCTALTSVTFGDSVTSIGTDAFYNCTGLTQVIVADVNKWAEIEFAGYSANPLNYAKNLYLTSDTETPITNLVLDTATKVGKYAFYNCTGLTSVTIGDSITSIASFAFYRCTGLTSVTIGDSVQTIGHDAFYRCTNLAKVIVENVNKFAEFEFGNSSANPLNYAKNLYLTSDTETPITNLVLDTATKVGSLAFYYCTGLTSVTIPNSVTSIGNYAFSYCTNLTSVTFGNSVTSIGYSAFSYCTSLTNVTIGNSVTSIGDYAFNNCANLTKIIIEDVNKWAEITFGNQTSNPLFYAQNLYLSSDTENPITHLVLDSATKIGSYAFYYCTSIESATIADSVKTIGESAFANCSVLTSINISNKVESIGSSAFSSNVLTEYENVYYLKSNDGKYSYLISMIDKTATLVEIHPDCILTANSSFSNCSNLTKVIVEDVNRFAQINFYDSTANPLYYAKNLYLTSDTENQITNLVLDTATKITAYAFYNCTGLTSVIIGNSVQTIGNSTFYNCTGLTSVTIPNSVTSIASFVFSYCTSLTNVTIGNSVQTIGDNAFNNCTNLTKVIVNNVNKFAEIEFASPTGNPLYYAKNLYLSSDPTNPITNLVLDTATKVGSYAFYYCTKLTSITIGNSVQTIGNYAFDNCTSLTSVTIGNSVNSIGNYAFYRCTNLTKVIVEDVNRFAQINFYDSTANPLYYAKNLYLTSDTENQITNLVLDTATKITAYAFYNCTGLTSVTIPNSVTEIELNAFYDCTNLRVVNYTGTEEEWKAITIGSNNEPLTSLTPNYNYVITEE